MKGPISLFSQAATLSCWLRIFNHMFGLLNFFPHNLLQLLLAFILLWFLLFWPRFHLSWILSPRYFSEAEFYRIGSPICIGFFLPFSGTLSSISVVQLIQTWTSTHLPSIICPSTFFHCPLLTFGHPLVSD